MTQIFVDMDGVLADFDTGYENVFGIHANKLDDNIDWKAVRVVKDFYKSLPPMPDFHILWEYIQDHNPIILTGVPASIPEAPDNKRAWVYKHIGDDVEVRCCRSRDKAIHCAPGDILIDDWEKYKHLWIRAGGTWITHHNATETILSLRSLGL